MGDRLLKLRAVLADWFPLVVVGLLAIAALGGWLTYATHADPGVEHREHVSTWTTSAGLDHSATVAVDTQPFSEGETVTNRPAYYDVVMPELDGTFRYTHTGNGDLETDVSLEYVVRAVEERDEAQVTLWEVRRPLANESVTLAGGEETTVQFTIDVNETIQRIETIEEELGESPGTTQALVRAEVDGDGTIYGEETSIDETHTFVIDPGDPTYTVNGEGNQQERQVTDTETITATYGPLREYGSVVLLVGSVLALATLGFVSVRGDVAPSDERRQELTHREARADFDDWITNGTVPPALLDREWILVDSLEGLVDVAIDTDERVIEDDQRDAYVVVDESVLYVCERPDCRFFAEQTNRDEEATTTDGESDADGEPSDPTGDEQPEEGGEQA